MPRRGVWVASIVIWGLYAVALFLPAVYTQDVGSLFGASPTGPSPVLGWEALQLGWQGILIIPTLANVVLLIAWIALLANWRCLSITLAALAAALALSTPIIIEGWSLGSGFFVWLACMLSVLAASVRCTTKRERLPMQAEPHSETKPLDRVERVDPDDHHRAVVASAVL